MAVHLSVGRKLSIASIVVFGLAMAAGSVPYLIDLGPEAGTAPEPRAAAVAPEPASTENRATEVAATTEIPIESQAGTMPGRDGESAAPTAERVPVAEETAERSAEVAATARPVELPARPATSPPAALELLEPAESPAEPTVESLAVVAGPVAEPVEPAESPAESLAVVAPASPLAEAAPVGNPALRSQSEKTSETAQAPETTQAVQTAGAVQTAEATAIALRPAMSQPAEAQPAAFQVGITVARLMTEPRDSAGPALRRNNMAPIPVRAPRPADAGAMAISATTMFERGVAIEVKRDANVYITSRNIPRNDRLLEAYSADRPNGARVQTTLGEAAAVPGLLSIAAQAHRARGGTQAYSLADAMRDAIWRKKTAARLKSLTTAQNTCASDTTKNAPSIGLLPSC